MPYDLNPRQSAKRHLLAAQRLYDQSAAGTQPGCRAVAGYLFGLAGELAIKELMRDSGFRPSPATEHREDPFFAHFPALRRMLKTVPGRRAGQLRKLAEDPRLFQHWDVRMRYASTQSIDPAHVDAWKSSAEVLVDQMEAQ